MTGKKIYPACVSRCYSPEELRSMEIRDSFCESEPLTLEEINRKRRERYHQKKLEKMKKDGQTEK